MALVGLAGGAGASVLAYLTAATAATESTVPVLVADTGGPSGALARLAGVTARLTLCELSERLAGGQPIAGPVWAEAQHGLRVIAGHPQFTVEGNQDGVLRVLDDARRAHGLTVVDAGTLARKADQTVLKAATHVAWVMLANDAGIEQARRVLERIAPLGRPELLIARTDPSTSEKPPVSRLADLADERRAQLVLMPSFGSLVSSQQAEALVDRAQVALQAIGGALDS